MSTKINHGVILKGFKSLDQAYAWCSKKKPRLAKLSIQILEEKIAADYLELIDNLTIKNYKNALVKEFKNVKYKDNPYSFIVDRVKEQIEKAEKSENRSESYGYDLSISIDLFKVGNKVIGLYHSVDQKLIKGLLRDKNLKDYHYQNSTDRPEDISQKEWKQREKDWDFVVDAPHRNNLRFTFSSYLTLRYEICYFDKVKPRFLSLDERANKIAEIKMANRDPYLKQIKDHRDWVNLFMQSKEWRKTEAAQNIFAKIKAKVLTQLIPTEEIAQSLFDK